MKKSSMSANLNAVGDLRYEALPTAVPGEDEVLVEIKACGICGSDLDRVYKKGTYSFPTVIGHEFSGRVAYDPRGELTDKRVTAFPLLPCFSCESCQRGDYATCENYDYYGSRRGGGMSEYLTVKRWNLLTLPDGLSFEEGAMSEPVSVARHAALKLGIKGGESILVTGAGPIGLIVGQWAKSLGADKIYYKDVDERKIDFAKSLGFYEYEDGIGVDAALEGTGYDDALSACIDAVKPHGRIVLMGNPARGVNLSQNTYWKILRREITVLGTWNSSFNDQINDWRESLNAMARREINVKPLISHRFPLEKCNEAFSVMREKKELCCKVMLYMNEEKE